MGRREADGNKPARRELAAAREMEEIVRRFEVLQEQIGAIERRCRTHAGTESVMRNVLAGVTSDHFR